MTEAGWIFMLISWAVILGLFAYSMIRTLSHKHRDQLDKEVPHTPPNGKTP